MLGGYAEQVTFVLMLEQVSDVFRQKKEASSLFPLPWVRVPLRSIPLSSTWGGPLQPGRRMMNDGSPW